MDIEKVKIEAVASPVDLGEGPHWSVKEEDLYYVDMYAQNVHRYHPASNTHSIMHLDGGTVALVVPHRIFPNTFIVSMGRDIAAVTWPDPTKDCFIRSYQVLASVDTQYPDNYFNDGKCDQMGRLWAGTMGDTEMPDNLCPYQGIFFILQNDATITKAVDNVSISNGLTWSPSNDTFYFIDSCEYKVEAYDCHFKTGKLSKRGTVYDYRDNDLYPSFPDGMTVDTDGNVWVACFGAAKVLCIEPSSGKVMKTVELSTDNVTSVCWGGPKLDHLYVTTSRMYLTEEQLLNQTSAGAVFRVTGTGYKGHPAPECSVTLGGVGLRGSRRTPAPFM